MTEALALKSSPASNSYCGSEGSKEHPAKGNVAAKFLRIYRSLYSLTVTMHKLVCHQYRRSRIMTLSPRPQAFGYCAAGLIMA